MANWQERITRDTAPGIRIEHAVRYRFAAPVIADSDLWADLGCGNGILGVRTAVNNPEAEVTFIDESYRAVASAEATFRANLGPARRARFLVGNGMFDMANGAALLQGSIDRVLNNPPFHENHAICDAMASEMFSESRAVLRRGGDLWVVGNRHLAYQAKLKHIFGNCEQVASNAGFVVLRAFRA